MKAKARAEVRSTKADITVVGDLTLEGDTFTFDVGQDGKVVMTKNSVVITADELEPISDNKNASRHFVSQGGTFVFNSPDKKAQANATVIDDSAPRLK